MIYLLDFREQRSGGAVVPGYLTRPGETGGSAAEDELRAESSVTFLLHGFNVDRPDGRRQLLELATLLAGEVAGGLVATLWPGDHWLGALNFWLGAVSYPVEGQDADDTAVELVRFIERVIPPGRSISFASHSLGARVVMETIRELRESDHLFNQVCLMAAAIDDDSLASALEYRNSVEASRRIAVLSSKQDNVLKYAYPVGDLLEAFAFWSESSGLALGYHGSMPAADNLPVPGNVFDKRIPENRESDHGHYLPDPQVPDSPKKQNQKSATQFTKEVLTLRPDPKYP